MLSKFAGGTTVEKSVQNSEESDNCPDGHPWSAWEAEKLPDRKALTESRHCTDLECRYIQRREIKWLPKGAEKRTGNGK